LLKNCLCGGSRECEICGVEALYECQDCNQQFHESYCQKFTSITSKIIIHPKGLIQNLRGIGIPHVVVDQNSGTTVYSNTEGCSNDDYFKDEEILIQAMMIATSSY